MRFERNVIEIKEEQEITFKIASFRISLVDYGSNIVDVCGSARWLAHSAKRIVDSVVMDDHLSDIFRWLFSTILRIFPKMVVGGVFYHVRILIS